MGSPLKVVKVGKVRLSIWEGEYQGNPTLSFTLDKPYKNKDGDYVNGKSFSRADLGNVVLACIKGCDVLYGQDQTKTDESSEKDEF